MPTEHFDLNDIEHEPTDEQLDALMQSVAAEANRRAEHSREEFIRRLREAIVIANRPQVPT